MKEAPTQSMSPISQRSMPDKREREIHRLRIVEGLTLREIGEQFGISPERVRQILNFYFRESGVPPAARERRARK